MFRIYLSIGLISLSGCSVGVKFQDEQKIALQADKVINAKNYMVSENNNYYFLAKYDNKIIAIDKKQASLGDKVKLIPKDKQNKTIYGEVEVKQNMNLVNIKYNYVNISEENSLTFPSINRSETNRIFNNKNSCSKEILLNSYKTEHILIYCFEAKLNEDFQYE